jgi:hypothetical protein
MLLFIEILVCCAFMAIIVIPLTARNPISMLYDYPSEIQARVNSLEQYKGMLPSNEKKLGKKLFAALLILFATVCILYFVNGIRAFQEAFIDAYIIWLSITWFDAIIIDCLWFCHSKRVRIAGTEDMIDEYHNYLFHIKASVRGSLIGIVVCLMVGLAIQLMAMFM